MTVELLAPARDRTCGEAAVNAGADAVYMGGPRFGARHGAANRVADVAAMVDHAHRYQARVYVALNTVLLEHELDEAVALLHRLHDAGIDGAIVQDFGLLEMDLPSIPLIASTQTHADSVAKVRFLEAAGFSRVILARELSFKEIAEIRSQTTIELETFVHGALCVCYSGQCYLSQAIGGRSANRGECAQPCRKRYRLVDGRGKVHATGHLLSPKDLNRVRLLADLLDAGVTSLKIEGRLKDAAYVANTVAAYRRALDDCLEARRMQGCTDRITLPFAPDLNVTFHRGYVEGFAQGERKMACIDAPKARGIPVGTVTALHGNSIEIDATEPLSPGDGLCFFTPEGIFSGTAVQAVAGSRVTVNDAAGILPGTVLHRNFSREFQRAVKKGARRQVPIHMRIEGVDSGLRLVVEDLSGNQGTATLSGPFEPARDPEQALARWKTQLEKTGATEFVCDGVELLLAEVPFVPVASMNDLRRRGLDELREARRSSIPAMAKGIMRPVPCLPESLDATWNVTNSKAEQLCRRFGAKHVARGPEAGGAIAEDRVMISKYCLRRELGACLLGPSRENLPKDLALMSEDGKERLRLEFDCATCKMRIIRGR